MSKFKIHWYNIYYMLSYAIDELKDLKIETISLDKLNSLDELLSRLMCMSMELINKHQLNKGYIKTIKDLDKPKGSLMIQKSYSSGVYAKNRIYCRYFELTDNILENRVIKTAVNYLIKYGKEISTENLIALNKIIDYLSGVETIDIEDISLQDIEYEELPEWYKPAISISKLIIQELMGRDKSGTIRLYNIDDEERLKYIFEKFVRNFYIKEYKSAITTKPVYSVVGGRQNRLDMLLEDHEDALVIDTKWYESKNLNTNRVANEREVQDYIISYKENEKAFNKNRKKVYGMILYARTDNNQRVFTRETKRNLGQDYGECTIFESTINLNQSFIDIKNELIGLADKIFK